MENTYTYKVFPQNSPPFQEFFIPLQLVGEIAYSKRIAKIPFHSPAFCDRKRKNKEVFKMKLLKCPICGNVVEMVEDHGVPLMCCGKKMEEVEAGAVDAALEKHVPVLKVEGDCLTAVVGDVLHPMTPEHLISNIWIEFADGSNKKVTLTSDDEPIAKFNIAGKSGKATVYEYCNLHGLWKTEIEL